MPDPLPVLLLTRPREASERFARVLEARGLRFRAVISPLFSIAVQGPLPDASAMRGLIFTSANGVEAWRALGGRTDLPAWCVGDATAAAARSAGMMAQSAGGTADDLVGWLADSRPPVPLLHLHGTNARGAVADRLTAAGLPCFSAVIYDQPAQPLTPEAGAALAGDAPVVAPVFSPRTGKLLAEQPVKAPLLVAAMSEAVAKTLASLHKRELKVARRPESEAMTDVVCDLLDRAATGKY